MAQSTTLFVGIEVYKDTGAVAYVAQAPGAEVTSWGIIGTPQGDSNSLIRKSRAKALHLIFIYEAGPCSSWR